jgi:hypothetical protein
MECKQCGESSNSKASDEPMLLCNGASKDMENTTQKIKAPNFTSTALAEHFFLYLPHKVTVTYPSSDDKMIKAFLSGISDQYIETTFKRKKNRCNGDLISFKDGKNRGHECYIENVKLMLVPLSKLKNINSIFFQEMNCDLQNQIEINEVAISYRHYSDISFKSLSLALKNHVDIFNLIPQELAISL